MTTVLGCDPALGGAFGIVAASLGEHLTVLDACMEYGFARTEQQLEFIHQQVAIYRPSIVIVEIDSQQKGLANDDRLARLADKYGFRIQPHVTRMLKMDTVFGVASMDQSFALGHIRLPWGDDATRRRMEPFVAQLRAWRPDIPTKRLQQDLVMALWFVWRYWQQVRKASVHHYVDRQARPAWVARDPRLARTA